MKKKILAGAITLLSVVTLAACSEAGGKDIITMKEIQLLSMIFIIK